MAALLTLLSLALPLVAALPEVTPVQVGAGSCSYYPGAPFIFHPDQADNSAIDGLYTSVISTDETVIDITTNLQEAKFLWGCTSGLVYEYIVGTSGGYLHIDATTGQLAYLDDGLALETYEHQVDGVTQSGIFLGNGNVTAWAFLLDPSAGFNGFDAYTFRLLESQDGALNDGEFYGFLKIVSN